jgi:hypothetical protein
MMYERPDCKHILYSDQERRIAAEESAVTGLQERLQSYQSNRTPENRAAYLNALKGFTRLIYADPK